MKRAYTVQEQLCYVPEAFVLFDVVGIQLNTKPTVLGNVLCLTLGVPDTILKKMFLFEKTQVLIVC